MARPLLVVPQETADEEEPAEENVAEEHAAEVSRCPLHAPPPCLPSAMMFTITRGLSGLYSGLIRTAFVVD